MENWELIPIFLGIAVMYSSVGFGGGSSYLAILTLFGLEFKMLRAIALVCNIVVVSGNISVFKSRGFLKWDKAMPLVFASVPMAFLGGLIPIRERIFFIILGIVLLLAGLLMLYNSGQSSDEQAPKKNIAREGAIGGSIGFLSGMVGIGGGIFLSPVLHLLKWGNPKTIAATASFFILVNSISGLTGQLLNKSFEMDWTLLALLVASVFVGGQIGSRLAAGQLQQWIVKRLTAILVIFVSLRILIKYLI